MTVQRFFKVAAIFGCALVFATTELRATWMLTNPTTGSTFGTTTSISGGGMTDIGANIGFTVGVYDDNGFPITRKCMNSARSTTTAASFGALVPPPPGGWTLSSSNMDTAVVAYADVNSGVNTSTVYIKIQ